MTKASGCERDVTSGVQKYYGKRTGNEIRGDEVTGDPWTEKTFYHPRSGLNCHLRNVVDCPVEEFRNSVLIVYSSLNDYRTHQNYSRLIG